MLGSVPDLLRLLAVPVFAWAAYRDVRTRRVDNAVWLPLVVLGAGLLAWDLVVHSPFQTFESRLFLTRVGVSLLFVAPLGYAFWRVGGFGGADAKALMTLALLFPTYPVYFLPIPAPALPLVETTLGVFSLTVLTNTVVVGMAYPFVLAARNAALGRFSLVMFLARVVPVRDLPAVHGRLFETREGFTRRGLDLDALRMYLRWRGLTLSELRAAPDRYRDPASVGETHEPTDGAVHLDATPIPPTRTDGGAPTEGDGFEWSDETGADPEAGGGPTATDDPWAAERFLDEIEGTAYGTSPAQLREGLETVCAREAVWISPGLPFIVPMFVGLLVALTYGDLLFGAMQALGLV